MGNSSPHACRVIFQVCHQCTVHHGIRYSCELSPVDNMTASARPTVLQVPDAEGRDIKRAYYSIMRDCHPDQSGDNEEANEFCKMLNDIYEARSRTSSSLCVVCHGCLNGLYRYHRFHGAGPALPLSPCADSDGPQ